MEETRQMEAADQVASAIFLPQLSSLPPEGEQH